MKLTGKVFTANLPAVSTKDVGGKPRRFCPMVLPFGLFRAITRVYTLDDKTGRGEQRSQSLQHVKKLRAAHGDGTYTVSSLTVGLYDRHRAHLAVNGDQMELEVDTSKRDGLLPILDGGHRNASLELLREEAAALVRGAKTDEERQEAAALVDRVDAEPVPFLLLLDGCAKWDFLALQLGRTVDRAHREAVGLGIRKKKDETEKQGELRVAFELAKELAKHPRSPLKDMVRFSDTAKPAPGSVVKKVPFTSLATTDASSIVCSLAGVARLGKKYGMSRDQVLDLVLQVFSAVTEASGEDYQGMTEEGKVLCPLNRGGVLGGTTLYFGIACCMLYMVGERGDRAMSDADVELMLDSAASALDVPVDGDMSGSRKRRLMGRFAAYLFDDVDEQKVGGVPAGLFMALSPSSFALDQDEVKALKKRLKDEARAAAVNEYDDEEEEDGGEDAGQHDGEEE